MNLQRFKIIVLFLLSTLLIAAQDAPAFISFAKSNGNWELADASAPVTIFLEDDEFAGVQNAVTHLQKDFEMVTGRQALTTNITSDKSTKIIIGTYNKSKIISKLIDKAELDGKFEKFIIQTVDNPLDGVGKALVIAGSDMR